jgi:hypothetical protein
VIVINRIPPEAMLEAHARARPERPAPAAAPGVVNIGPARALTEPREVLVFRGKRYRARPVPFERGLDLLELAVQMERAGTGADDPVERMRQLRAAVHAVVDLCWSLQRPAWCPRALWRLRRNPFRAASLEEVREIVGFTGQHRTT